MNSDINLVSLTIPQGMVIHGPTANSRTGASVSGAGDMNGDGIADLLVVAQSIGSLYIIWGKDTGWGNLDLANFSTSDGVKIYGGSNCMAYASNLGDVNGDGVDDCVIGVPCLGKAYVIFGKITGWADIDLTTLTVTQGIIFTSASISDHLGTSVSRVGDINNDGISDIAIGASGLNGEKGAVYFVFGKSTAWDNMNLTNISSPDGFKVFCTQSHHVGGFISSVGDVTGDGIDDFAIGIPWGNSLAGAVVVVFGKNTAWVDINIGEITLADGFLIFGSNAGCWTGRYVGGIDINNDSISDLIIAAPGIEIVYLLFGKNTSWSHVNLSSITSTEGIKIFGTSAYVVRGVADANNDGFNDILIGDPENNISYLIFGKDTAWSDIHVSNMTSADGIKISGINIDDWSGGAIEDIGDFNNDGITDIAIGSPEATYSDRNFSGEVSVIFGSAS